MKLSLPRWRQRSDSVVAKVPNLYILGSIAILLLWLAIEIIARIGAEMLWFEEVGYLPTYLVRIGTQGWLGCGAFAIATIYLWGNLSLAQRLKSPHLATRREHLLAERYIEAHADDKRIEPMFSLRWLLSIAIGVSLAIWLILVHYLRAAIGQSQIEPNLPSIAPPTPALLRLDEIGNLVKFGIGHSWIAIVIVIMTIAMLMYSRYLLRSIAIILSLAIAWVCAQQWLQVLPFFQPTAFGLTDPVFDRDISTYVFGLPVAELLEFSGMGICLYGFISVVLTYLLAGDSLSQGKFFGFTHAQQRHLCGLGGALMLVISFSYWISCGKLLYSPRGVSYGASYTDINVQLPVDRGLSVLSLAIAGYLLWRAIYFPRQLVKDRQISIVLGAYLGLNIFASNILPFIIQAAVVQPNELAKESPYIQRTIAMTRQAFGLDNIASQTFDPQANLTEQKIQANDLTIRNIRLWDEQPLLATNRQLQQIRLYYRFLDADIDRYNLATPTTGDNNLAPGVSNAPSQRVSEKPRSESPNPLNKGANPKAPLVKGDLAARAAEVSSAKKRDKTGGFTTDDRTNKNSQIQTQQQVLISARELDYPSVPESAQTWVNEHMIYTHGYGFTLSPVNRVAQGGLPEYFVKDIGTTGKQNLNTSNDAVRANIPVGQPRIYYGENTNTYVMTGTKVKELDYPSGNDNVYNIYDGRGGIKLDSLWRRLIFAKYLNDWRMVLTPEFLPETKLLLNRNIDRRIRSIAPFLRFDRDPYLVATDARQDPKDASYLYWIVDAYTTSDLYPYADIGKEGINYIRNSVKIVIDAYHGSVRFYIADPGDPIVRTWAKIFPNLFEPLNKMPANLRQHIRYPEDIFKIQSERLISYHMTDPQVFYNQEDRWQVPTEVYGDKPKVVEPYYLITSLPNIPIPEFTLLLPYTPQQRTNLVAWLAARSDGENYGKLVLYKFPKQRLVFGPEQIEARINQDPTISAQISLWNRQGSRVLQGNLLIVPIDRSLLYVEPIYLEATQNQIPTLVRVVVAYENRIVMAESLNQALKDIFRSPNISTLDVEKTIDRQI